LSQSLDNAHYSFFSIFRCDLQHQNVHLLVIRQGRKLCYWKRIRGMANAPKLLSDCERLRDPIVLQAAM
jgi:hypothetical protein